MRFSWWGSAGIMVALLAVGACSSSHGHASSADTARHTAQAWVAALNSSDVGTVARLACTDEGFRTSEIASARSGTDLGPYHYRYYLRTFAATSPQRASANIVQRLTTTVHGRTRSSDLPGSFAIVLRHGRWFVCPAGTH